MKFLPKKNIYLDYAGATLLDKSVSKKMANCERVFFHNPSAIYDEGVKARNIIEENRKKIATLINAHNDEIIFTGSGTESNAMAILGVINNYSLSADRLQIAENKKENKIPHIITTQIEHPAVLENCRLLEKRGQAEVSYISVDANGFVDLKELKESLRENTILVSVMYANNEIGTIEPIQEIAKIIRHFKKEKLKSFQDLYPVLHTDACQAMNYLFTENVEKLGVDLMSFNSSKIYGPKGVGVLYKKRNIKLEPLYEGGGQEFGLRSGTESISLIVGASEALSISNKIKQEETKRLIAIRDYGIEKLLALSEQFGYKIILNGDRENRLPNNINISVFGISSELLVIELSAKGIFVSEKSACKSDDQSKSYVIRAIRKDEETGGDTDGSLRISLGRQTTRGDMDSLVKNLKNILEKYNKFK